MPVFEGAFQNIVAYATGEGEGEFERTFLSRIGLFDGASFVVENEPIGSCSGNTCENLFGGTSTYSVSSQLIVEIIRTRTYYQQEGFNRCLFDEIQFDSAKLIYTGDLVTNSRIDLIYSGAVTVDQQQIDNGAAGETYLTGCENIDADNPFYEDYPIAQQEFTWTGGSTLCCLNGSLNTTGEQIQSPAIPRMPFREIPPFEYEGAIYKILAARLTIAQRNGFPEYFYEYAVTQQYLVLPLSITINAVAEALPEFGTTPTCPSRDQNDVYPSGVYLTHADYRVQIPGNSYVRRYDFEACNSGSVFYGPLDFRTLKDNRYAMSNNLVPGGSAVGSAFLTTPGSSGNGQCGFVDNFPLQLMVSRGGLCAFKHPFEGENEPAQLRYPRTARFVSEVVESTTVKDFIPSVITIEGKDYKPVKVQGDAETATDTFTVDVNVLLKKVES